jgi:hypothetical protein
MDCAVHPRTIEEAIALTTEETLMRGEMELRSELNSLGHEDIAHFADLRSILVEAELNVTMAVQLALS